MHVWIIINIYLKCEVINETYISLQLFQLNKNGFLKLVKLIFIFILWNFHI